MKTNTAPSTAFNILNLLFKALLIICPTLLMAQPAYDLQIAKPVALAPYKIWQKDQVYGFMGMANVNNVGTKPFINPKLQLDIAKQGIGVIWSDNILYSIPNTPMTELFDINTVGTFIGNYSITQDSIDSNPGDNQLEFSWAISDSIMAKEDIGKFGIAYTSETNNNFAWGNIYHIEKNIDEKGHKLHCNYVQVGIGNGIELGLKEASIFLFLYKFNDADKNNLIEGWELQTVGFSQYDFSPGDPDNEVFTMPMLDFNSFNPGVPLESNSNYILAVQFSAPSTYPDVKCYVLADPNLDYSLSVLRDSLIQRDYGQHVLDVGNTGDFSLSTLGGHAVPVIRMSISPENSISYISGKVFLDLDCDKVFNNQDEPINNHVILEKDTPWPSATTDVNGDYLIELENTGTFEYAAVVSSGTKTYPTTYIIENDTLGKVFQNRDFAVCYINSFHDLEAILSPYNLPRPGFENKYDVCIKNWGSHYETAKLIFDFKDANVPLYTSIVNADGGNVVGHTVTWDINNLKYYDDVCKTVTLYVNSNTPLGTIFKPHVQILYDSSAFDITPLNNEKEEEQEVVGSFDPNDKSVNKTGFTNSELKSGVELEYTIRFQNTGTFPATFIEVLDTLQNTLDIDRFEMLSASHEYTFNKINNKVLKWRFDNINLPDSTSNEPGSHGYIKFRIMTKENLTKQDVISNSAAIYFDFNIPIFTNTAKTEFVTPTFEILSERKLDLVVFPNPTTDKVTLQFELPEKVDCKIEIRDVSGKLVYSKEYKGRSKGLNEENLDLSNFGSGIYLLTVFSGDLSGEVKVVRR